jgi:hypothetical protein
MVTLIATVTSEVLVSLKLWIVFSPDGEKLKLIGEKLKAEATPTLTKKKNKNARLVKPAWLFLLSFIIFLQL